MSFCPEHSLQIIGFLPADKRRKLHTLIIVNTYFTIKAIIHGVLGSNILNVTNGTKLNLKNCIQLPF